MLSLWNHRKGAALSLSLAGAGTWKHQHQTFPHKNASGPEISFVCAEVKTTHNHFLSLPLQRTANALSHLTHRGAVGHNLGRGWEQQGQVSVNSPASSPPRGICSCAKQAKCTCLAAERSLTLLHHCFRHDQHSPLRMK